MMQMVITIIVMSMSFCLSRGSTNSSPPPPHVVCGVCRILRRFAAERVLVPRCLPCICAVLHSSADSAPTYFVVFPAYFEKARSLHGTFGERVFRPLKFCEGSTRERSEGPPLPRGWSRSKF